MTDDVGKLVERLRENARMLSENIKYGPGSKPEDFLTGAAADMLERLSERCEAYKGQVEAGAAEIELLRRELPGDLPFALNEIALQIQAWLDWNRKDREKAGLPVSADDYVIPPVWPVRGALELWVTALKQAGTNSRSPWQPMETIPKDGTPILAYCDGPYNGGAEICSIWFDARREQWRVAGTEESLPWAEPLQWMPQPVKPDTNE